MSAKVMLVEKIRERMSFDNFVSFVELTQACGQAAKGELALEVGPNLVWWVDLSREFIEALADARREGILPEL